MTTSTDRSGICAGRTVIVTGAGRGLGREYALEFAREGAHVVVNDFGGAPDGSGSSSTPADETVAEIESAGGIAVADHHDVASWDGAREMVETAVERFGSLDVLVNNAGILRDGTIVNMTEEQWDSVVRVHLRGTFAPTHWAAQHWRERSKSGSAVDARLITTTSSSGLYPNAGQANYAAAKAGIAAFTVIAAAELARYGVTANCIYPTARSRLTEDLLRKRGFVGDDGTLTAEGEALDPSHVAPFVVWLGSPLSAHVTGRVFGVRGRRLTLAEGWRIGPVVERDEAWTWDALTDAVTELVAQPEVSVP